MSSKHPLDREDPDDEGVFDFSSPQSGQIVRPEKRILRWSIWAIGSFGVLVVLSSVALNNTAFGSAEYQIARGVNVFMAVLLLLSFASVLIAYQLENIRGMINRLSTTSSSNNIASRSLNASVSPIGLITVSSLVIIAIGWATAYLMTIASSIGILLQIASGVLPGLMIAMIIWNKGCTRAFAIGVLASHVLSTYDTYQSLMLLGQFGMNTNTNPWMNGGSTTSMVLMIGTQWTMVALAGLLPAWYVWLIDLMKQKNQEAAARQLDWKPTQESDSI